jgi:hypothetical protein
MRSAIKCRSSQIGVARNLEVGLNFFYFASNVTVQQEFHGIAKLTTFPYLTQSAKVLRAANNIVSVNYTLLTL